MRPKILTIIVLVVLGINKIEQGIILNVLKGYIHISGNSAASKFGVTLICTVYQNLSIADSSSLVCFVYSRIYNADLYWNSTIPSIPLIN